MPFVINPPSSPPLAPSADDGSFLWQLEYDSLGYLKRVDEERDFHLRRWLEAECAPLQPAWDLLRERADGTPPYGILYDVDRCPAELLPFLALHVGARLTADMDEQQRRDEIRQPTTWRRGDSEKGEGESTLKIVLRRTLTGSRRVIVREREPDATGIYVRTLKDETPYEDVTAKLAEEWTVAGLVLDYEAIDGVTWADIAAAFEDWGEVEETFSSWADLADTLPDELPEP